MDLLNRWNKQLYNPKKTVTWQNSKTMGYGKAHDLLYHKYQGIMTHAKAFDLAPSCVTMVCEMAAAPAKVLAQRLSGARLPYPVTWVELPYRIRNQWNVDRKTTPDLKGPELDDVPTTLGMLLQEDPHDPTLWSMTTIVESPSDPYPSLGSIVWMIDTQNRYPPRKVAGLEALFPSNMDYKDISVEMDSLVERTISVNLFKNTAENEHLAERERTEWAEMRHLTWGYGVGEDAFDFSHEMTQHSGNKVWGMAAPPEMRNAASWGVEPVHALLFSAYLDKHLKLGNKTQLRNAFSSLMRGLVEVRGHGRWTVTLLSILGAIPYKAAAIKPKGFFMYPKGTRPYLTNHIVELEIPTIKPVQFVANKLDGANGGWTQRRHEVRGHFRTSDTPHGEDWKPYYCEFKQRTRFRRWIESHEKGSAEKGYVSHTYEVAANKAALEKTIDRH